MSYYRIQIDELQNGEKRYIPQKAELRISRSWIQRQEIRWYNILQEGGKYGLSDFGTEFGVPKPEISDWQGLSYEEYENHPTELQYHHQ